MKDKWDVGIFQISFIIIIVYYDVTNSKQRKNKNKMCDHIVVQSICSLTNYGAWYNIVFVCVFNVALLLQSVRDNSHKKKDAEKDGRYTKLEDI